MKDYYEILGVPRDATEDQIKKAYRRLARKLHPDVAGTGSEEAFKDLSVAYETLSNPRKRQAYDMAGEAGPSAPRSGAAGGFPFDDIFETMFGGGFSATSTGPSPRGRRGQDSLTAVEVTLEDVTFGTTKPVSVDTAVVCPACHGTCCAPGTSPQTCSTCGGSGTVTRVQRSLLGTIRTSGPCPACGGHGTTIPHPCPECSGEGRVRSRRTLSVEIPTGVDTGTRIRLSGQGEAGPGGGPAGDLYVEVRVKKHKVFTRRGDDLHTWITVPMTTAALGTVFELQTLDGSREVRIKPGTQPNDDIALSGLGVGHLNRAGRGDLHVHVEVEIPKRLDDRSQALLEELAELRGEKRFEPVESSTHGPLGWLRGKLGGQ